MVLSEAMNPPPLTIDVVSVDRVVEVVVVGEVDFVTADQLRNALAQAIDRYRPGVVVIDCAGLSFLDAAGMTVLVEARRHAKRNGGELRLRDTGRQVSRLLALVRLDDVFGVGPREPA